MSKKINPLLAASSRRPIWFRRSGEIGSSLASPRLGSPWVRASENVGRGPLHETAPLHLNPVNPRNGRLQFTSRDALFHPWCWDAKHATEFLPV